MASPSNCPLLEMEDCKRDDLQNSEFTKEAETSSLMRAVRRGIKMTEKYLNDLAELNACINITGTNVTGKNVFHLSVQKEEVLEFLLMKFKEHPQLRQALCSEDINGHTPAHLAAFYNVKTSIQLMATILENLFSIRSKRTGKSLIHCAVESGNEHIVQYILKERPEALSDKDNNSRTVQHYAAYLKNSIVLEYLLSQGVDIMETDTNGSTSLHAAAEVGSISNVKLLVLDDVELLKIPNISGETALHVACVNGHRGVVSFLLQSGADPLERDRDGRTTLECAMKAKQQDAVEELLLCDAWKKLVTEFKGGPQKCFATLLAKMPQAAKIQLNRCIENCKDVDSDNYSVTYDFFLLQPTVLGTKAPTFEGLAAILEHHREDCLMHAVCQKYLSVKWLRRGYLIYSTHLILYLIFHVLFNVYVMMTRGAIAETSIHNIHGSCKHKHVGTPDNYPEPNASPAETALVVKTVIIVLFTVLNMVKELIQMYIYGWRYFKKMSNYFEWTMYISVLIFMLPVRETKTMNQFGFGSIAIFFSWFNLIWFMRRIPDIGTYILTLQRVFTTLLKMLMIISLFCVAFACTFYLLLAEKQRYSNFPIAVLSTLVSMLGDYAYDDHFALHEDDYNDSYYVFKLVAFTIFLLLMTVVVNNVLIGLAVGDTDCVMKLAKIQRVREQAKFIMEVESSVICKIPCFSMTTKTVYTEYPNRKLTFAEKVKNFLFGEANLWPESDETETDGLGGITKETVEEIVKTRLESYHKHMAQELKDFSADVMEVISPKDDDVKAS